MKPIIVKVCKNHNGEEYVMLSLREFQEAIDGAYDAGFIDGRKAIEKGD